VTRRPAPGEPSAAGPAGAIGASAHRGPKTIMTGERLGQLLDPFGNLFGVRQAAG
jgi:hypothetical protein